MRCPWYLFHRLFLVWARTKGPYDLLLPGGPMSCQSAPGRGAPIKEFAALAVKYMKFIEVAGLQ
ncbi:unnamed protein product [Staurois parvus]|uniref:Uncharacterized protein n=1 Tax=Staurois parvus TaxID=386267 RepID=A0ABN9HIY3_9NEOB|nr:unnamed protein product [Staurois parvus]